MLRYSIWLCWYDVCRSNSQPEQKCNKCRFGEEQKGGSVAISLPYFPLLLELAVELLHYRNFVSKFTRAAAIAALSLGLLLFTAFYISAFTSTGHLKLSNVFCRSFWMADCLYTLALPQRNEISSSHRTFFVTGIFRFSFAM